MKEILKPQEKEVELSNNFKSGMGQALDNAKTGNWSVVKSSLESAYQYSKNISSFDLLYGDVKKDWANYREKIFKEIEQYLCKAEEDKKIEKEIADSINKSIENIRKLDE